MFRSFFVFLMIFIMAGFIQAQEPSYLQYFFTVKKILPETKTVGVFIDEATYSQKEVKIKRAATQSGVQVKVFLVTDRKSIGKFMKELQGVDVLLLSRNSVLDQKSSRIFILSRSKEMNIPVISSSQEYSKSGAFLYLYKDENHKTHMVVNLKQTPYLAHRFGDEEAKKMGISKLIR